MQTYRHADRNALHAAGGGDGGKNTWTYVMCCYDSAADRFLNVEEAATEWKPIMRD